MNYGRSITGGSQYYVYILTNDRHTVLYTGVTSDLIRRVYQQRQKIVPGFTQRYNVTKLVYFEVFSSFQRHRPREADHGWVAPEEA